MVDFTYVYVTTTDLCRLKTCERFLGPALYMFQGGTGNAKIARGSIGGQKHTSSVNSEYEQRFPLGLGSDSSGPSVGREVPVPITLNANKPPQSLHTPSIIHKTFGIIPL